MRGSNSVLSMSSEEVSPDYAGSRRRSCRILSNITSCGGTTGVYRAIELLRYPGARRAHEEHRPENSEGDALDLDIVVVRRTPVYAAYNRRSDRRNTSINVNLTINLIKS